MQTNRHRGGCHCAALRWEFHSGQPLEGIAPRACDCDFCQRHGAAWVSDNAGRLCIAVADDDAVQRYRQGSSQADFLLCGRCGVLAAVVARTTDGRLLGAVNARAFDERDGFAPQVVASPRQLAPDAKLARWAGLWTPVDMTGVASD